MRIAKIWILFHSSECTRCVDELSVAALEGDLLASDLDDLLELPPSERVQMRNTEKVCLLDAHISQGGLFSDTV